VLIGAPLRFVFHRREDAVAGGNNDEMVGVHGKQADAAGVGLLGGFPDTASP
jgi:hypothetical protein